MLFLEKIANNLNYFVELVSLSVA